MNKCDACGSYAINHHLNGRDGSEPDLCDVCFWRKRHGALEAELAKLREAQEPVATVTIQHFRQDPNMENVEFQLQAPLPQGTHKLYASPVAQQKVVMPERRNMFGITSHVDVETYGWNSCLDEFERLNGGKP